MAKAAGAVKAVCAEELHTPGQLSGARRAGVENVVILETGSREKEVEAQDEPSIQMLHWPEAVQEAREEMLVSQEWDLPVRMVASAAICRCKCQVFQASHQGRQRMRA